MFPNTIQKGCVFHYTQAIYRRLMAIGLGPEYSAREDKYRFLRKVMALPFLPAEHIKTAFEALEDTSTDSGHHKLLEFMSYVRTNWIESSTWRLGELFGIPADRKNQQRRRAMAPQNQQQGRQDMSTHLRPHTTPVWRSWDSHPPGFRGTISLSVAV